MHRKVLTLGLIGVLGIGAVACGSSTTTGTGSTAATGAATVTTTAGSMSPAATSIATKPMGTMAGASFNTADITFASSMIPHHQQAVTMAEMALDTKAGASTAVKDLATRIKAAQGPEITMMQGWLSSWGTGATPTTSAMGGMNTGTAMGGTDAMDGMMSDADMTKLGGMNGTAFDTMWLTMMITHHQGAVTMSQTELTAGASTDAKALATKIITAQNAEIADMKKLLG